MKAAVLRGARRLAVEERPDPGAPGPGQVRVRVRAVGVCGSDVHYFAHGRIGGFVVREPMILGHEAAGTVDAVGEGVTGFQPGDVVAMEPGVPCMACGACRAGRYNLCADVRFFATPPVDGVLADAVLHPAGFTHQAPAGMTADVACLAEPVSVAIQAVRKANVRMGERALVVGAGPIGVLTALVARYAGAAPVLSDVRESRLTAARSLGLEARQTVAAAPAFDLAFECSGAPGTLRLACECCRAGGTVVQVGMHQADAEPLPVFALTTRELTVRGVFRYANTYPAALEFLERMSGRMAPFFSSFIGMEEVAAHFGRAAGGQAEALKTIVRV